MIPLTAAGATPARTRQPVGSSGARGPRRERGRRPPGRTMTHCAGDRCRRPRPRQRAAPSAPGRSQRPWRRTLDPHRPGPHPVLVRDARAPRELPPQVDHPRQPVDRAAAESEVALVGDRRVTAPGDPQRRSCTAARPSRWRSAKRGAAELGVAVGVSEQVRARGADRAAARVARSAVLGRARPAGRSPGGPSATPQRRPRRRSVLAGARRSRARRPPARAAISAAPRTAAAKRGRRSADRRSAMPSTATKRLPAS